MQAEHLPVIAALVGGARVTAERAAQRGGLGINLLALVPLRFAIGEEVILVANDACAR